MQTEGWRAAQYGSTRGSGLTTQHQDLTTKLAHHNSNNHDHQVASISISPPNLTGVHLFNPNVILNCFVKGNSNALSKALSNAECITREQKRSLDRIAMRAL
jgi:hypothetical protein